MQWATLIEFVKHLGRNGKCKIKETPKRWFITYIDRDSETLFKEEMKNKRITADIVVEEKQEKVQSSDHDQPSQVELHRELNVEDGTKVGVFSWIMC